MPPFMTLGGGHIVAKYQKYMSLRGEFHLLNIPHLCKTLHTASS